VAGEVDDEVYQREIGLLSTGLEAARHELDAVNEAVSQLSSGNPSAEQEVEVQVAEKQSPQPEETFLEEPLPAKKEESAEPPAEPTEEAVQCAEESAEVKAEEKQETQ